MFLSWHEKVIVLEEEHEQSKGNKKIMARNILIGYFRDLKEDKQKFIK